MTRTPGHPANTTASGTVLLGGMLLLVGGALATGIEYMSGQDVESLLSGKRIEGEEDGTRWRELFTVSGRIEGDWGGESYQGYWMVKNGMLCLDYRGTTDDGCWYLSRGEGDLVLWFMKDGTPEPRRQNVRVVE